MPMKYIFLDNRRDLRKCNPLVLPSLIAGGASLLGGLFQRNSQAETNKKNLQIARETNEAQERIAAANNQTQIDMMRENNDWSAKQAELSFQREADYNSAESQVGRYLAAGLNPALMMQNSGATSASASAPSAAGSSIHPSMPNFVTPTMQAPPSVLLNASDAISKLASSFAQMKQGENVGKQTSWIDRLNESTVKNLTADALGKEAKAKFDTIMAQLNQEWMPQEAKARIEKLFAETTAAYASGELDTANAMYTKLLEQFKQKELDILNEKAPFLVQEVKETVNLIKQKQQTEKSAQSANYASAEASKASARVSNETADQLVDMHDAIVSLKTNEAEMSTKDLQIKCRTLQAQVDKILHEAETAGYNADQAREYAREAAEKANIAEKENKSYYWRIVTDLLGKALQAGAMVYGIKLGSKAFTPKPSPQNVTPDRGYRYDAKSGIYY